MWGTLMKRKILIFLALIMLLLAGCASDIAAQAESESKNEEATSEKQRKFCFHSAEEVEQMSDDDLVYINQHRYDTVDFYEEGEFVPLDLFGVELDDALYENIWLDFFWLQELEIELDVTQPIPEDEFERLVQKDIEEMYSNAEVDRPGEETGCKVISEDTFICGENDLYAEYSVRYTERNTYRQNGELVSTDIPRVYRKLYLKNYIVETNIEEWRAYLLGELSAEYVKEQLDVFYTTGNPIIYREVVEEEDCYVYIMYFTTFEYCEAGVNNEVILWRKTEVVDKETHLVTFGDMEEIRRAQIEGTEWDVEPVDTIG